MKTRQRLECLHENRAYSKALGIITRLQELGHETVFAGGCVRDGLMGRVPKDLDIATAAPPDVVESAFERTLAVGKEFGTIVVVLENDNFEVTTFRKEGPYYDGRHPSSVGFTDMEEDASRRDFTVNALFYDPMQMAVVDFVGGIADMQARRLRTVGKPEERFSEDRLRMLRAIRFVAQLGFELDVHALRAIRQLRGQLLSVSAERILNEVKRFLTSTHLQEGLSTLQSSGLEEYFWPETKSVVASQLRAFPAFNSWENAFAALMLLAQATTQEDRLRAWKASRETQRVVSEQMRGVQVLLNPKTTRAERLRILGGDCFADILVLVAGLLSIRGERGLLEKWIQEYLEVANADGTLPKPYLTGQDLISLEIAPGARMGELIKGLYDAQLEGQIQSKASARDWILQNKTKV